MIPLMGFIEENRSISEYSWICLPSFDIVNVL
jgi:hypothetical protein